MATLRESGSVGAMRLLYSHDAAAPSFIITGRLAPYGRGAHRDTERSRRVLRVLELEHDRVCFTPPASYRLRRHARFHRRPLTTPLGMQ